MFGNVFGPDVALRAEDVLHGAPASRLRGNRLEAIDLRQRNESADGPRLAGFLRLAIVEIAVRGRRHDHVVAFACAASTAPPIQSMTTAFWASPPWRISLQPMSVLPCGVDEFLDAADEIALQLVLALEPFRLHARLALRALFPVALVDLVAADVNVFAREQLEDFGEHVFEEVERRVVARAIDVRRPACRRSRIPDRRAAPRRSGRAFRSRERW